jgi:hypothetical protein
MARPRERIKVYRLGLVYTTKSDGTRLLETTDLDALRKALGDGVLVSFLRCFVWADRLQSLIHFGYLDKSPTDSLRYMRDLNMIAWFGGGVLYEAADAVIGLEKAGVVVKLADTAHWRKLRAMARRWLRNRLLIRVRNNFAFHVDPKTVRKGVAAACQEGERRLILGSDGGKKAGHFSLSLGIDLLLKGLNVREVDLHRVIRIMAHDHAHFSGLVQKVFSEALKGCGVRF